jgi:acetyl-CoA carboxylase carboxyltransferase component
MNFVRSPLQAQLVAWCVQPGQVVRAGEVLVILEAMKMEHEVPAPTSGRIVELSFAPGEPVDEGDVLLTVEPMAESPDSAQAERAEAAPETISGAGPRADLQKFLDRQAFTLDGRRPEDMAKRHALGLRSARENLSDLCDDGSFIEYGALAIAAQRGRRPLEDLIARTPADGVVTGVGSVNGTLFGRDRSQTAVMAYDPTVLAGTQGKRGHQKADRILGVALKQRMPLVLLSEGGGGRPGDDDMPVVAGLHMTTFANFARLNGHVPIVGITAGRCFAGNASLLGCCDVIIATQESNIGMGGPAMVEGGGLGVFRPEQIGPASTQHANGVIDILVDDEQHAVVAARQYLSFFQGVLTDWIVPDTLALRDVVPENRQRAYDSRGALTGIVDQGSLLELRTGFGRSIHTALARIEGRPVGLLASNPLHLGGAIDADAADKAARFMRLCSNFGIALVSLVDTPGFMVGPDVEEKAQVRHTSRMFIAAAHLRVPFVSIVLRKGYGLGAMAMTAGGFHEPALTASWPTGEFGGMGLEGYVRLGYKKELEALPVGAQRDALFDRLVRERYDAGSAINMAATLEIDAVIDPAETRIWLARALVAAAGRPPRPFEPFVDAW